MTALKPKRRWLHYSQRTLLVVVTLFAIWWTWLAVMTRPARREREAAAAIEKLGGIVEWTEPQGPEWVPGVVVGDDFYGHVKFVGLETNKAANTALAQIKWLDHVENVVLDFSNATDADLENLSGLKQLERLNLRGTRITDTGLESLKGLNELQELHLDGTQVTDRGVERFRQALPNCKIER